MTGQMRQGFAARANAVYCIQDLSERKASKTTESPFLRKADEASLSANVASYRIGCKKTLNEKNDKVSFAGLHLTMEADGVEEGRGPPLSITPFTSNQSS